MEILEFFVTQILREIKVSKSRVSKSAISTRLDALNLKWQKTAVLRTSTFLETDFTQNMRILKFPQCGTE